MVKRIVQKAPQKGAKKHKKADTPLRRSTRVRRVPDFYYNYESPPRVRPGAQVVPQTRNHQRAPPAKQPNRVPKTQPVHKAVGAKAQPEKKAPKPQAMKKAPRAGRVRAAPKPGRLARGGGGLFGAVPVLNQPAQQQNGREVPLEGFDIPPYLNRYGPYRHPNENKYMPYKFDGSSKYDDDELFDIPSQANGHQDEVSLSVMPVYTKFDATSPQEIPCMISLKANERQDQQHRLGMDVICVIDISGSMSGQKINQVLATLRFILHLLGEKDRLCLIVFDHRAFRLCPLTRVTADGRLALLDIINNIFVLMHNEIEEGLRCALIVLKDRRLKNDVTSVLLLSDGIDSINQQRIDYLKRKSDELDLHDYFIHTFGYGAGHNPAILKAIADKNDGNFYFVEKDNDVAPAFANCIGELATIVVEKPEVYILNQPTPMNCTLLKVYSETGDTEFSMPSLLSCDRNDSIFVVGVDAQGEEGEISPIKVKVQLKMAQTKKQVVLEEYLKLEFVNMLDDIELNEDVLINYLRVKAADALKEIAKLADMNLFDRAKQISFDTAEELKNSPVKDSYIVQALIKDLENSRQRAANASEWARGGKAEVVSITENHKKQKGAINSQQYMNSVQASFVSQSQQI